jgi:hypothetical protein
MFCIPVRRLRSRFCIICADIDLGNSIDFVRAVTDDRWHGYSRRRELRIFPKSGTGYTS